jgi:hypothetical protein
MNQQELAALGGAILGIACLVLGVALVIAIFYFLTLQKALNRVSPHNRLMEPGLVWLGIIPLFSVIWSFFLASRIPDSLRNEFRERNRDDGSDYGKGVGMANAVIGVISLLITFGGMAGRDIKPIADGINTLLGLISLVLWIVFWVKIANYSNALASDDEERKLAFDRRFDEDDDGYGTGNLEPKTPPSDAIKEGDAGRYQ